MRPIELSFHAFGPYPGTQSVNFERLGQAGLFVVSGPTGAGKTSVFDAMTFALYGELPGSRKEYKSLRSDHAAPGEICSVTFSFEAGAERWQVWRQPEQVRPKKRGNGTTSEKPKALLSRWAGGEWQGVTNNLHDVTQRVTTLLGLTPTQFQRVMLLPQGEFQRVLRAATKERKELLRTLFATDAFAEAEKRLAEQSAAAGKVLAQLDTERSGEISRAVRNLTQAAEALGVETSGHTEPEAIGLALESLTLGPLAKLGHQRDIAKDTLRKATMSRQRASEQQAARRRLAQAQKRREELATVADEVKWGKDLASYAREALPVAQAEATLVRTKSELAAVSSRLESAVGGLPDQFRPVSATTEAITEIRLEVQKAQTETKQLLAQESEAAQLGVEISRDEEILAELTVNRGLVQERLDALSSRADSRSSALAALKLVKHDLSNREAKASELTQMVSLQKELTEIRGHAWQISERVAALEERRSNSLARISLLHRLILDNAEATFAQASALFEAAKQNQGRVLTGFTASTAPALAEQLAEGTECPVCGSCEHPNPAVPQSGGSFAVRDVQQAQTATLEAAEVLKARSVELEGLRASLAASAAKSSGEELPATSNPEAEVDELQVGLLAIDDQLSRFNSETQADLAREAELKGQLGGWANAAAEELAEAHFQAEVRASEAGAAAAEIDRLEAEAQTDAAEVSQLKVARLTAATEQERLAATITERRGRLLKLQAGLDQLKTTAKERMKELEAVASTTQRIADILLQVDEVSGALERAKAAANDALAASPFDDLAAATQAGLPIEEIKRLEQRWEEWTKQSQENEAITSELMRHNLGEEAPDLPTLTRAEIEATQTADQLADAFARTEAIIKSGHESLVEAEAKSVTFARERELAEATYRLAEVCRGNNQQKASLETWVLASHLRDVVEHSNFHLGPMSNNRYQLRLHDGAGVSRRRETGLDLEIEDAWTSKTRAVNSLSGGETFQASLALALGLADVISAGSSGVRLDALFVDEGFGSLDADSLDHAIDVLDNLRDRGALVGVITHVDAVKEALTVGLEIERTPAGGSRLRQLV